MPRSQTVRENLASHAAAGLHPGNYPLGYMPGERPGDPHVPDPATAPAVAAAFRLRARGWTVPRICEGLAALGVRSSRGQVISPQALRSVLANPFYVGAIRLNGRLYPGRHEVLVSAELFAAVQVKRLRNL